MWADPRKDNVTCQRRPAEGGTGGMPSRLEQMEGLEETGDGPAAVATPAPLRAAPSEPDAVASPYSYSLIRVVLATVAAQLLVAATGLLIMSGFDLAGAGLAAVVFSVGLAVVAALAAFRVRRRSRAGMITPGSVGGAAMGFLAATWLASGFAADALAGPEPLTLSALHTATGMQAPPALQPWKRGVGMPVTPGTRSAKMPPACGWRASVPSLSPSDAEVT